MADMVLTSAHLSQAIYSCRVELGFLVSFALLWALSVSVSGKRRSKAATPRGRKAEPCMSGARANDEARIDVQCRSPTQLRDSRWLLAAVQQLCSASRPFLDALQLYRDALRAGLDLKAMPEAEGAQLFLTLVTSAIRANHFGEVMSLLQDCRKGPGATAALLASCVKVCTSKQMFKECIEVYNFFSADLALVLEDASVWSCLLFCATEMQAYRQCSLYFDRLRSCGAPSSKDFTNMTRCAAALGDWRLCLSLVQELEQQGREVENPMYNTALASCVAAEQMDEAVSLCKDMESCGGVADTITYNTLSKGYAKLGSLDKCFELLSRMRAVGLQPSQVTYGILLDVCMKQGNMEKAEGAFNEMAASGLTMNTVLYTTLIKGFICAERIDVAMRVYRQMWSDTDKGVRPDLITFSILIKAHCDVDRLHEALALKQAMVDLDICPDEVIFNNLLGICVARSDTQLAKLLYSDMIAKGVKPSNATFSILICLYEKCKLLHEAVDMLSKEPEARGVEPEARLFLQLVQACLRERQSRRAVEVYNIMLRHLEPGAAVHHTLLGICTKLNMLDAAAEILACAVEKGQCIDVCDAVQLRDVCIRKRKAAYTKAIAPALAALGITTAGA